MFDSNYYIEFIKHYPPNEQSVEYIESNYDDRLIDDPMEFIDSITLPTVVDFSIQNIFLPFFLESEQYPLPERTVLSFSSKNIFIFFFMKTNDYPYAAGTQRIKGIDYNKICSTFQIKHSYPYNNILIDKIDYNNIFSLFKLNNSDFYNYPSPAFFFDSEPEIPGWKRISPSSIDKRVEVSATQQNTIDEFLRTKNVYPQVKDRDKNKEAFQHEANKYWRKR